MIRQANRRPLADRRRTLRRPPSTLPCGSTRRRRRRRTPAGSARRSTARSAAAGDAGPTTTTYSPRGLPASSQAASSPSDADTARSCILLSSARRVAGRSGPKPVRQISQLGAEPVRAREAQPGSRAPPRTPRSGSAGRPDLPGQKPHQGGRQRRLSRGRKRGGERRRTRNRRHADVLAPRRPHQHEAGIREYRRAGITHQHDRSPVPKSVQRQGQAIRLVVLVKAPQPPAGSRPRRGSAACRARRVSSARIKAAPSSTSRARGAKSSRVPMGVATIQRVPTSASSRHVVMISG